MVLTMSDFKHLAKTTHEVSASALAETLPGVATLFVLIKSIFDYKQKQRFSESIDQLRTLLDKEDYSSLEAWITEHGEEDWLVDGFEQGFRVLMGTMDEKARKCALIMIAHYMKEATVPDRIYRQFGEFFQQSDEQILRLTYEFIAAAKNVIASPAQEIYVVALSNPESRSIRYDIVARRYNSRVNDVATISSVGPARQVQDACDVLIRCGFLSAHTNPVAHPAKSDGYDVELPWGKALPHQIKLWELLYKFLTPFHR